MGRLIIERQDASIEINSRRAQISIQTPRPKMTVKTQAPKMIVRRTQPRVRYNQQPLWQNRGAGIYTAKGLVRYVSVDNLTPSGKYSPTWGDSSANAAMQRNQHAQRRQQTSMPRAELRRAQPSYEASERRAHMEYDMGSVSVEWEIGSPEIEWDIRKPIIEVEPYSVEIRMRRYPKVKIMYRPDAQRKITGRRVDKMI